MPIDMGAQFKGLPMGDLIGAPLMAACDAQVRLANATASFIQQIGFIPGSDGKNLDVREVAFRFSRPSKSMTIDQTGKGVAEVEQVELQVPLLAIVKVPALAIDTVDITFDMEVKNVERQTQVDDQKGAFSGDGTVGWGFLSVHVHVEGSVSTHKENTRETDQSAKYHVEVHASDKGMPEGLARVLDIMHSAIAPVLVTPQGEAKPKELPVPGAAADGGSAPSPGSDTLLPDHALVDDLTHPSQRIRLKKGDVITVDE